MIPKSLVNTANANVSQALQTGARGQTQTTTDYGVIGDAFFKKAQLDLNIANLQADMGYKKASLLSGLEMQRANLELQKGELTMKGAQMAEEQRRYEKSQHVSDSEKLLGSLGGAAQGALTGFMVGGVPGAVIGGAAGGLMTYGGYQQGGRQGGQQAQQTLGTIAGVATTFKGLYDQQVKQDAWKGIAQTGADLIAQYNSASTPQEQLAAQQSLDAHIGNVYQTAMTMPGANPEQVGTMVANYRKGLEASVGLPSDQRMKMNQMKQLENMVSYQSDPRASQPAKQREWAMDYMRDSAAIYEESTGRKMSVPMGLRNLEAMSPKAYAAFTGSGGTGSMGQMPARQPAVSASAAPSASQVSPDAVNSQQPMRTPTPAPVPEQSMPVPFSGGIPWRPAQPSGPGIEMDDGGSVDYTPVSSEQQLTQMGGPAAETFRSMQGGSDGGPGQPSSYTTMTDKETGEKYRVNLIDEQGNHISADEAIDRGMFEKIGSEKKEPEKMSMMDKIKHNLSLSDEEFDKEKAPLWEDRVKTESGKKDDTPVRKIRSLEQFESDNAELDAQISKVASGSPEGTRAKGATKVVDRMIDIVKNEEYPADSQAKAFGAKIYNEGLNVGGIAGAGVGAAVAGGRGAAAGAFLGSQQDLKVGEGMGPFLSDDEEFAVSEMEKYKAAATMKFAKIQDPGGKISDADAKRFQNLWPRPGQTREQQLAGLLTIKEMMLDELGGATASEGAEQDRKLREFEEKEKIKARYKKPSAGSQKQMNNVNDFFRLSPP